MLILISDSFDPTLPDILAKYGDVTSDKTRLPDATVVLIRSKTKVTREYIDSAPKLKLVIRGGVGLDNVDQVYAKSKNIMVFNTAEASTIAVAELAFALMIALPNQIARADASMREGKWVKSDIHRTELMGKTLGILGLGRIGLALAFRAQAFRMRVLGWHPDVYFTDFAEIIPTLEETVAVSDYVSLHMPLVPSTKGLIDKKTLACFKDGAYVINTGRGQCVVEEDMVEALKSGKIGGYATDVWYSDPPQNSPLIGAPNCIFTPHIGAESKENMIRIGQIIDRLISEHRDKLS
jgi:phosphoglycerate dehydrogenase-like enzyme